MGHDSKPSPSDDVDADAADAGDATEPKKKNHKPVSFAAKLKRIAQIIGGVTAILVAIGAALGALKKDFDVLGLFGHAENGQAQTKVESVSVGETITIASFGTLIVGGKCDQTTPPLRSIWNCVADNTKRAHCQQGIVVVEICSKGCKIEGNGKNDLCHE